jgi:hypothetical protein
VAVESVVMGYTEVHTLHNNTVYTLKILMHIEHGYSILKKQYEYMSKTDLSGDKNLLWQLAMSVQRN